MCGEKQRLYPNIRLSLGSPPRVRGKDLSLCKSIIHGGITPACAGKSNRQTPFRVLNWDHPRVCGEKGVPQMMKEPVRGSPPRVRGKAALSGSRSQDGRITPACAGKSAKPAQPLLPVRDHPRVCGEKSALDQRRLQPRGSPPRVRGKVSAQNSLKSAKRITPACAGKRIGENRMQYMG